MALWGKTDNQAGKPKFIARKALFNSATTITDNTISLLNANTGFNTGDEVLYSIEGGTVIDGLTDATTYFVRNVGAGLINLYDTYAHAVAASGTTGILVIASPGVGVHSFTRTGAANAKAGLSGIYFVDRTEAGLKANKDKGFNAPGWWLYKTYTDGNSVTRHKAECIIALDVIAATSGDASDDSILADA